MCEDFRGTYPYMSFSNFCSEETGRRRRKRLAEPKKMWGNEVFRDLLRRSLRARENEEVPPKMKSKGTKGKNKKWKRVVKLEKIMKMRRKQEKRQKREQETQIIVMKQETKKSLRVRLLKTNGLWRKVGPSLPNSFFYSPVFSFLSNNPIVRINSCEMLLLYYRHCSSLQSHGKFGVFFFKQKCRANF